VSVLADLEIVITGCVIVMAALALLWGLTVLLGCVVALGGGVEGVDGDRRAAPVKTAGLPLHHLVAIAAAVEAVIGAPHRIVGIVAPAHRVPAWAGAGRHRRHDHRPVGGVSPNKRTDGS